MILFVSFGFQIVYYKLGSDLQVIILRGQEVESSMDEKIEYRKVSTQEV